MIADDAVELTHAEATLLAKRLVARHIAHDEDWITWEDVPLLSEQAWLRLFDEVTAVGEALLDEVRRYEWANAMDSAHLLERATS